MMPRSALTRKSPVSTSMHWNKDKPTSTSVGKIKNMIITFDEIRFLFKDFYTYSCNQSNST